MNSLQQQSILPAPKSRSGETHITLDHQDLTNRQFGNIYVIKRMPPNSKRKLSHSWECKCKCGKELILQTRNLVTGKRTSCGCIPKSPPSPRKYTIPGEASCRELFGAYRRNAEKRGLIFNLSLDEFKILTSKNCFYCGDSPYQIQKQRWGTGDYIYNGIDRVNNSLGYVALNCVPCCGKCNFMKSGDSQESFKTQIFKIYLNLIKNAV
jgi:hypothetical protein